MKEKTNETGRNMTEMTITTEAKKQAFEHQCYEIYRLYWMLSSEKPLKELTDAIHILAAELVGIDPVSAMTAGDSTRRLMENAEQSFLCDSGFCGAVWANKEKFLSKEFRDPSYMKTMLSVRSDGDEMWEFYQEHYAPRVNKYTVTLKVEGRFVVTTRAKNIRKAKEAAVSKCMDADFEPLQNINKECIIVEDVNGNFLWETSDPEPDEK